MPLPQAPARTIPPARLTYRDLVACGSVLILSWLVYINALHNPFVYDDQRLIVANTSLLNLWNWRAVALHEVTRPLVNLSYAIDRTLWGPAPFGFHVTSLALHLVNVALVYVLASRLAQDRIERNGIVPGHPRPGPVAFATSLLFAIHPVMTEAVGYVAGRSEVLCATFFLCAVLAMRHWMLRGGAIWLVASIVGWLLALGSKEIAVMFPFVILAYDRLVAPGTDKDRRWRVTHLHLPFYAVGLFAVVVRLAVFARAENSGGVDVIWSYVLSEIDVVRRYVLLLLMFDPNGQTVFHSVPFVARVFSAAGLIAIGSLGFLIWLIWALDRAGRPAAALGIIWFLLLLVPSSALVIFNRGEPMAEHRVYLASVGLFMAVGTAMAWLALRFGPDRPFLHWLYRAVATFGVLSMMGHTVIRNAVWSSPISLWAEAVDKAPDHWYPALLLGESLHDAGDNERAVAELKRSIKLRPSEAGTYGKAGICLIELGRLDDAQGMFESLRKINPWMPEGTNGLGTVALARGQLDLSRQEFQLTIQNNHFNVPARVGLAAVEERAGHPAAALGYCEEIQRLAPDTSGNDACLSRNRAAIKSGSE